MQDNTATIDTQQSDSLRNIVQGVETQLVGADDPGARMEGEPYPSAGLALAGVVADGAVPAVGSHRQGSVQDHRCPGLRGPEPIVLLSQPVKQGPKGPSKIGRASCRERV